MERLYMLIKNQIPSCVDLKNRYIVKKEVILFILFLVFQRTSAPLSLSNYNNFFLKKKVYLLEQKVAYFEKYKDTLNMIKKVSDYFWKLGQLESSGNYDTTNILGYLGKYQFGIQTLRTLGFTCTPEEFLSNPLLQEQAIIALNIYNDNLLRKKLNYDSLRFDYLAGAHLGGADNVVKYVKEGYNPSDYFGTNIKSYIEKFKN